MKLSKFGIVVLLLLALAAAARFAGNSGGHLMQTPARAGE
jgi:hypothetical protein